MKNYERTFVIRFRAIGKTDFGITVMVQQLRIFISVLDIFRKSREAALYEIRGKEKTEIDNIVRPMQKEDLSEANLNLGFKNEISP